MSPIVMFTANVDAASKRQILLACTAEYFPKPIDTQHFYQTLIRYLGPNPEQAHVNQPQKNDFIF
ncbi:MAG: response regulator of citrate/malate metabolism [Paraglaciecola sp.]|jgi:response regulator of citrate/malate metabolism